MRFIWPSKLQECVIVMRLPPNTSLESFASLTGTGRLRRPSPQLKR